MANEPDQKFGPGDLGGRVDALLKLRNMSRKDLALAMGVGVDTIDNLVGGRAVKKYLDLADYARALATTPNYLLGFQDAAEQAGAAAPGLIDERFVTGAVQGLLQFLGIPRDEAEMGARIAVAVAKERHIVGEDPVTQARISAHLQAMQTLRKDKPR